jgi:hypothetical protein
VDEALPLDVEADDPLELEGTVEAPDELLLEVAALDELDDEDVAALVDADAVLPDEDSEPLEDEELPDPEAPLELPEAELLGRGVGGTQVPLAQVQPTTPQSAVVEHWLLQPTAPRPPAIANASTRRFMTLSLVDRREAATCRRTADERAEASTRPAGRTEERCRRDPATL